MAACLRCSLRLHLLSSKNEKDNSLNGEAFNFGPKIENKKTVLQVVKEMKKNWTKVNWTISNNKNFKESKLLQLNSIKAKNIKLEM